MSARLYYLDVGQGMCTYFEESDGTKIVANALFDLGSTKNSHRAGTPTIKFLVERIKARDPTNFPGGYLDRVFLSHKDADHVNLFWYLLAELPHMQIGMIYHSGRYDWYYNYYNGNILYFLGARTLDVNTCVRNFNIGFSSFNTLPPMPIWSSGHGTNAYVIAVNTSWTEYPGYLDQLVDVYPGGKPNGDLANSTSLGIYLKTYQVGAVLFGDATFSTMQFSNLKLAHYSTIPLPTFSMQAPHHGSRLTTFGLNSTNAAINDAARADVDTFAKIISSSTVVVSADTKHNHPSLETINAFVTYADMKRIWWTDQAIKPYHYASVYFDVPPLPFTSPPYEDSTYQTSQNFYTTLYCGLNTFKWDYSFPPMNTASVPPTGTAFTEGMNWFYEIPWDGSQITLDGVASKRLDGTAAGLDALFSEARTTLARTRLAAPLAVSPSPVAAPRSSAARAPASEKATLRGLKRRP